MSDKVSPLFHLFDQQYNEAKASLCLLSKSFKSKKAQELEEKLIFLNIYLHLLSKIHFTEENLRFEPFDPFKRIGKALKRIRYYKLAVATYDAEKGSTGLTYNTYDKFLATEKKELYREVYDIIVTAPLDVWEPLYATAHQYSQNIKPLMIDTSATKLINEEIEYLNYQEKDNPDSQSIKEIMEGLQTITAVENIKIAVGFNSMFTEDIHGEMKKLSQVMTQWFQNHLFCQHLNYFFGEKEIVGTKYLELAKSIKTKKLKLTEEVASLSQKLFVKWTF
jgi:hypothetical protein